MRDAVKNSSLIQQIMRNNYFFKENSDKNQIRFKRNLWLLKHKAADMT